jgi:hypothetical protein
VKGRERVKRAWWKYCVEWSGAGKSGMGIAACERGGSGSGFAEGFFGAEEVVVVLGEAVGFVADVLEEAESEGAA